jgi:hypothetical protein
VEVQDEEGRRPGRARLHELIGAHLAEDAGPEEAAVGIETDRGQWVQAQLGSRRPWRPPTPRRCGRRCW